MDVASGLLGQFLSDPVRVVLGFSNILFMYELLFCVPNLPRRPRFASRIVLATAFWQLFNPFMHDIPNPSVAFALYCVLMFLVSASLMLFLFDTTWQLALFYSAAAYPVENMTLYLRHPEEFFPVVLKLGAVGDALKYVTLAALLVIVYRVLVMRYRDGGVPSVGTAFVVGYAAVVLLVVDFLSIWVRIEHVTGPIYAAYGLASDVLLLAVQFDVFRRSAVEQERLVLHQVAVERAEHQRAAAESMEIVNVKFHDLKHQVAALRHMSDPDARDKSIDELEQALLVYDSAVSIGNDALDTVLTEKRLACVGRGIELTCIAKGSALDFMGIVDIYTLFGNALDNAIEAVSQLENPSRRIITLHVATQGDMARISVENACDGPVEIIDGLPAATSKDDPAYHGFGLKSIRMIAERYGGNMAIDSDAESFRLSVFLPLQ